MWITGHSNIDKEKSDEVAKISHSSPKAITISEFSYTDSKKYIKNHTTNNITENRRLNLMQLKC